VIRIRVDDCEIEAEAGQTLLGALDGAGLLMREIDVPHLCWHPKLSVEGACRLCQVEVEGREGLQIACDTPVLDGMVVRTRTARARAARERLLELQLLQHPLDCPICDRSGDCRLQDAAFEHGRMEGRAREPRRAAKKKMEIGPHVVLDQERCVLCRLCVRFCREVTGTGELAVLESGDRSVVDVFPGGQLDNPYSMNVTDLCPVGALTARDQRFANRPWSLEEVPSVCSGCSKGCNVSMGVSDGSVRRYTPRRNDAVNDTWLCDAGRLSWREVGAAHRIRHPLVREAEGRLVRREPHEAVAEAAARLRRLIEARGPGVVAGVASARATNEDLFNFGRLFERLGAGRAYVAVLRGEADGLLVQAEKAPNGAGARAFGFADAAQAVERIRGGAVDALVVFGSELLDTTLLGSVDALAGLDTVIAIDTHKSDLELVAHVVLPARHAAEQRGTFTNHAGRVQAIAKAAVPGRESHELGALTEWLGAALGLDGFDASAYDVEAVSRAMGRAVPAFEGIDLGTVGAHGRPLNVADAGGAG
jgi:NADH-quinone oxidoreductase subunit G